MDKEYFYQGIRSGKQAMTERMEMCGEFARLPIPFRVKLALMGILMTGNVKYLDITSYVKNLREEYIKKTEVTKHGNNI